MRLSGASTLRQRHAVRPDALPSRRWGPIGTLFAALLVVAGLAACGGGDYPDKPQQVAKGERLVARFPNRSRSFTWNGRANRPGRKVTDGYLFVRFKTGSGRGEARRVALRRVRARLSLRPPFQRRDTCDLLTSFKLERPVFGGTSGRPLGIAYRLGLAGRVTVTVTRGSRTVKRYTRTISAGARTQRIRLSAKGLAVGDYRVRLQVRSGRQATTAALVARRL